MELRAYQRVMPKVHVKLHDWSNEENVDGLRDGRLKPCICSSTASSAKRAPWRQSNSGSRAIRSFCVSSGSTSESATISSKQIRRPARAASSTRPPKAMTGRPSRRAMAATPAGALPSNVCPSRLPCRRCLSPGAWPNLRWKVNGFVSNLIRLGIGRRRLFPSSRRSCRRALRR
jgi:hypothetical protein